MRVCSVSVARGENTPDSDVDVLIVLKQPMSLLTFFALNDELETALGCKVDLVTRDNLNPRVSPSPCKSFKRSMKKSDDGLPPLKNTLERPATTRPRGPALLLPHLPHPTPQSPQADSPY